MNEDCPACLPDLVEQSPIDFKWKLCPEHARQYPPPRFVVAEDGSILDTDTGVARRGNVWLA